MFNWEANEKTATGEQLLQEMQTNGNFDILPYDGNAGDITTRSDLRKLELGSEQMASVNALLQNIPSLMTANTMSQMYVLKFPEGLPQTLVSLKRGGFTTTIRGDNGQFAGTASLHPVALQATMLAAFSAMSIATGQYFLSQINSELKMMKLNIDKILEFLYGDKKAELMAEVSFVKYAYENFNSIMCHKLQRVSTISSLQAAKKIAMKDIEFYVGDLDSTINSKDNSDIVSTTNKAFQAKESLEFSIQLYVMSNLLEVYYAQNQDASYIQYVEKDVSSYIDKCEKRMLSSFSALNSRIHDFKGKIWDKVDKSPFEKRVSEVVELLKSSEESILRKALRSALHSIPQNPEYYINRSGNVYVKAT